MREKWSEADVAFLLHLVRRGKNSAQIYTLLKERGKDRSQKAIIRKTANERKRDPIRWRREILPPPVAYRPFNEQMRVEADNVLILMDIHAPLHHARFLNDAIDAAISLKCDTVIIGGDAIDWDTFSPFHRQPQTEAEEEIAATKQIFDTLSESFKRIHYFGGNHEMRAVRTLEGLVEPALIMSWFANQENVECSNYHWCELVSSGEEYLIEHPRNASVIPTRVAQALCSKYLKHVITGHGHLWGITRDISGTFWAIESGICADSSRFEYTERIHSKRPSAVVGAVMVLEGIPWLMCQENVKQFGRVR